jgi:prefoldin subunit 5
MPSPNKSKPTLDELRSELDRLRSEHERLRSQMVEVDRALHEFESADQREARAARELRKSVLYCGDIVSPTGEAWDAER